MDTTTKQQLITTVEQFMALEIVRIDQLIGETTPQNQYQYSAKIIDRGDCIVVTGDLMINYERDWIHPTLNEIVAPYGLLWEWETPENIVLC